MQNTKGLQYVTNSEKGEEELGKEKRNRGIGHLCYLDI